MATPYSSSSGSNYSILSEGFSSGNLTSAYDTVRNNSRYGMDLSGSIQVPPGTPGYVPTIAESQYQDVSELLSQENTIYALSAIAGVSVLILTIMIVNREANS